MPQELKVTVAVVGPVFGFPEAPVFGGPGFQNQGPDIPYVERLKVEVRIPETATLGDVLARAIDEFGTPDPEGVVRSINGVVFYESPDDERMKWRDQPWPDTIRLVDDLGKPSWRSWWVTTRYDELLAASAAGLVDGDPLRPYYWPVTPQGDLLHLFHHQLWTLWLAWGQVLALHQTVGIARKLLERVRKGQSALSTPPLIVDPLSEGPPIVDWNQHLGRPQDLMAFLADQPRTTEDVASLLGCESARTEGLLWGMGFACGDDGKWRASADPASSVLHRGLQDLRILGEPPTEEQLATYLREFLSSDQDDS